MIRLCTYLATHLSGYSLLTKMLLIVLKCRGMLALRWSSVGQETSTHAHMRAWNSFGVAFAILSLILPLPPFIPWFRSCCQQTGASERVYPVILKLRLACDLADHWCHTSCRPSPVTWMTMAGGRMSQVFLTSDSEFYLPKAIVRLFGKFANRLRRVWGTSLWMARSPFVFNSADCQKKQWQPSPERPIPSGSLTAFPDKSLRLNTRARSW